MSERPPPVPGGDALAISTRVAIPLSEIGFAEHLSPTRSNGLHAMLEFIYNQARACAQDHGH